MTADVVVIGAGFAGLSAATGLAEAGLRVVVVDEAPRLGGRATAFVDRVTGERVDNGQHVLFGCYRETFRFLDRLGTSHLAPIEPRLELTMVADDGAAFPLVCPAWQPPWHLVAGLMRWRAVTFRDRLSALRIGAVLQQARRRGAAAVAADVPEAMTAATWLDAHGQSHRLREWLWNPLGVAALNQSPDRAAARPFVRVLCEMFGPSADDAAVALPRVPLDQLYAVPAAEFIEARGGEVLLKSPAHIDVDENGAVTGVRSGDRHFETAVVVSAVPWHAIDRIWSTGIPDQLAAIVAAASAMESSPIVTVNLWFDRPVIGHRFVGFPDGALQWAFDKSVLYAGGARHVALVASGADDLLRLENSALEELARAQLDRAFAAARAAQLTRAVCVREARATFSLAPGQPSRPVTHTPIKGLFLAGDWTDTGLPATIEGAVLSGHRAAAAILRERADA